jgi:hypothetical protein
MRIGIISDIHDNIWALEKVLGQLNDCEVLLCLGDLCAPFTMAAIGEGFAGPVHLVWGNNDGDKLLIAQNAAKVGNVTLHGDLAELELGGRKIAMTHYPHIGRALAAGQQYDLVCHGHDHDRKITPFGKTIMFNPGEVMGRFGVHSYGVYDTGRGEARIVEIAPVGGTG